MAERIDSLPALKGRPLLYPWAEWMDGSVWRITRGEDFQIAADVMAQIVRQRGLRHKVKVSARLDGDAVEFQFGARAAA